MRSNFRHGPDPWAVYFDGARQATHAYWVHHLNHKIRNMGSLKFEISDEKMFLFTATMSIFSRISCDVYKSWEHRVLQGMKTLFREILPLLLIDWQKSFFCLIWTPLMVYKGVANPSVSYSAKLGRSQAYIQNYGRTDHTWSKGSKKCEKEVKYGHNFQ